MGVCPVQRQKAYAEDSQRVCGSQRTGLEDAMICLELEGLRTTNPSVPQTRDLGVKEASHQRIQCKRTSSSYMSFRSAMRLAEQNMRLEDVGGVLFPCLCINCAVPLH